MVLKLKTQITDDNDKQIVDGLVAEINNFVVHSNQDGTRPNSFGVSIAPPEFKGSENMMVSTKWSAFQKAYAGVQFGDPIMALHIFSFNKELHRIGKDRAEPLSRIGNQSIDHLGSKSVRKGLFHPGNHPG